MNNPLPSYLRESIESGAKRLGRALDELGWPSGDKNAPCSELNALINIQYYLSNLDPPFYFYSEGTIAQTGRIDLIGSNGEVALAMEAKGFGPINSRSNSAFNDLQRLRKFVPAYSKPASPFEPRDWWQEARERWGLLLVMSFRGVEVKEAWEAHSTTEAYEIMQSYKSPADRPADESSGFMALLQDPDMIRFGARITHTARWGKDTDGWLLCGAIPLAPHVPSSTST